MEQKTPVAVVISDTHLSEFTVEHNINVFSQVLEFCENQRINQVIHLGDVFTSRKGQLEIVLITWKRILDMFSINAITLYVIPGNHDKQDYTSESSYLEAFEGHPSLVLIRDARTRFFNTNVGVHFVPYFDEKLTYKKYLEKIKLDEFAINVLCTHCAINGVVSNSGIEVNDSLETSLFKNYHLVLCGHYHNTQKFNNVVYIGSTDPRDFSEDNDKGLTVLYDDGSVTMVALDFVKLVTVEYANPTLEQVQKIKKLSETNKVRAIISGTVTNEVKEAVCGLKGVKTVFRNNIDVDTTVDVSLVSDDILQHFDKWCEENKIADVSFGRELLVNKLK